MGSPRSRRAARDPCSRACRLSTMLHWEPFPAGWRSGVSTESDSVTWTPLESARLRALVRVAQAGAISGGLDGVLHAIAEGVKSAFGFNVVLNLYDGDLDRYVVRAGVGEGFDERVGTWSPRAEFEALLLPRYQVV